ncbi:MerR family transcriptional regulator [Methylomonas sp. TEB]|uniref:MerR family transcriptional regulator n=1 Tax=Methylomonas sp. TEB TaxID=3398229 RepID=UPI0039F4E773
MNFAQCRCGASLSTTRTTEKVYGSVLRISQALEDSLTQISAYAALPPLELAEWIRLITYLGQFTVHFQPAKPGKIANLYRADKAFQMVTQTAQLLEDWPKPFHRLLSVLQSQSNEQLSIRKTFGSLYRVLYTDLPDDCFQFLRDAFEQYLCERWSGVMCRRHRAFKPETVANHPRLTWKHAAKQSGVTPSVFRHLIQAEQISVNQVDLPSGRTVRSIDGQQLKHLALAKAGCTLKEVAHRLAIPERRVRELLAEHIIEPLVSRTQGNAAAWLISERQLERLYFSGLEMNPLPATVTFQKVLKHWRLRQGEFKALVQALLSNQLIPVGLQAKRAPLGKLVFDERQFRHWVTELRDAACGSLSVDEAANRLGLKQQVAYELVKVGLLAATQDNGSSCRISPAALKVFSENYISLADYARSLHRQPRAVLQSLKVQPVSGPTIDGSRQYFYRRTDLET